MAVCRVLHCAETIKGGIATYLRDLIPLQCAEFGPENVLVVVPASQVSELPVPPGVQVEVFSDEGRRPRIAFNAAARTLELARAWGPTVVHVHSTFAGATVRPLLWLGYRSVRVIYCAHGWAWDRPMHAFSRTMTKGVEVLLARITDKVICISEHEFRSARDAGLPTDKLSLVRNGVSVSAPAPVVKTASPWPEGKLKVLFVGRFDEQKGVDVLLEAVAMLGEHAHAVLAGASVVGGGGEYSMPSNGTAVGWVSPEELEALFAQADVLVVPSRWEGFGLIAVEGMRAGLPVVASAVGGLPEVVQDGITGLIVEPNSSQALVQALLSLDGETLARMGEAGRCRARELFSIDRLHRELCTAYAC